MARSLAVVTPAGAPIHFFHAKTGRRYRVYRRQNELLIEEFFLDQSKRLVYSDQRTVKYAIGSGNHAQSFLVERSGRLYQAPVTFFAQSRRWDMSPGYDTENYVGFTRRVAENCLFCHAGRPPEMSIGCERCHGPGRQHMAQPGRAMVNPAKLAAELRDQVCEQCHLFGEARVTQPGISLDDYRAGEPLGAVVAIYEYDAIASNAPTVTGHPQEMKRSICRQRSQGRLWCGSCHEVHTRVQAANSAAFYRAKCLNCHAPAACSRRSDPASTAHRENNCIACHMPKRPVAESAHVSFTDHRILRRPQADGKSQLAGVKLKAILPADLDDPVVATRNLGFAYAQVASSTGRDEFHRKAVETLQPLVGTSMADAAFWRTLGESHLTRGEIAYAEEAFRHEAELDPGSAGAHYSLGYLFQRRGKLREAIQAYQRAVAADPSHAEALGNLAAAYSAIGEKEKARKSREAALKLEPGNLKWRAAQSATSK